MDKKTHLELSEKIKSFPTFSEILTYRSVKSPDNYFLIQDDEKWTYNEFDGLVNSCCRYFTSIGLKPGNAISFVLRNSIDFLIIYFASIRFRIILNPFPYHMDGNEIIKKLDSIHPQFVFCHENHNNTLSKSGFKIINIDEISESNFPLFLKIFSSSETDVLPIKNDDVAVYYSSSGTTGGPKIIEYTHRSMVLTQASMVRAGFSDLNTTHLCVLPLGHTASIRYTIKQCICTGSTVVLYDSFWKLRSKFWKDVQKHSPSFMQIVPTILIALLNTPYKDYSIEQSKSLRYIGCGSAFLPKNLQDAFEKKYNIPIANLYGLSETGATHFDNPFIKGRKTGNIGRPFDIFKVKIFNKSGKEIEDGKTGEIGIKGPGIFKGYLKNHEHYNNCFNGNYFMTGDLGLKGKSGNYYYIDRKKDIIIQGGVNIAPSQIEEILQSHRIVKEAAVIGIPDMLLGEKIICYLVPKDINTEKLDIIELEKYCEQQLGSFKTPKNFILVESLPKGSSGKILKRELRSNYSQTNEK